MDLRDWRDAHNLSLAAAAEATGTTELEFRRYETGRSDAPAEVARHARAIDLAAAAVALLERTGIFTEEHRRLLDATRAFYAAERVMPTP